ncbi:MAG: site-specific integrase [Cohaesibacteraceae bacterium]|nr:site-specific integrase [Cohaesibacteraceae bacterium]
MSKDELARYWQALDELQAIGRRWQMDFHAIRYLLMTGRRKEECLGLKWEQLDFENGIVSYPNTKTGVKIFPLADVVIDALKTVTRLKGCDYVFASLGRKNTPINEHTLYSLHEAICELAEIENLQIHDLRRTVGSQMRLAGVDLADVADILGNADLSTTKKYYAHLGRDGLRKNTDMVAAIMAIARVNLSGACSFYRSGICIASL